MSESTNLRHLVFRMVAAGDLTPETAMVFLRRTADLAPLLPAAGGAAPARDIAVVGMAGRFGNAPDLDAYWRMLEAGETCLVDMPERRWPNLTGPRRKGGFLPDEDRFDPLFFRISPTEAAMMDPQQRLFLEAAFHALEDAGYAETALSGMRCGVFAGAGAGDYAQRFREAGLDANAFGLMGNVTSILAARISYFLNLKGPAVALDTACSSSLVAVHLACESLLAGSCDMALAGGVAVISTPQFLNAMVEGGMLSPHDRCASFDAAADGFVCGEGAGVVVLKRLADAQRDGDAIHGVIRGSGINQDGRTNGITAPSAPSQAALEAEVYARAGIDPATLSYVETHGTGTPLGDPIEVEALTSAFRRGTDRVGFCALGSAKANIGHALTAAGIAGLLKVLLMLRHRRIPPMAGFRTPNPRIDFAASPFVVPAEARDWQPEGVRRAAVSSFGFSGTNAHVVIEEAPGRAPAARIDGPLLFLLSARSTEALRARAMALAARLAQQGLDAPDVAFTLAVGREHYAYRLAVVADDLPALRARLQGWLAGDADASVLSGEATPKGPGPALVAFGAQLAREAPDAERLRVLGDLYTQGAAFDWKTLPGMSGGRRVSLPGYPFERVACGIPPSGAVVAPAAAPAPAVAAASAVPVQVEPVSLETLRSRLTERVSPDLSGQASAFQAVESWGRRSLLRAYDTLGLFRKHVYTVAGLRKALGIAPAKHRLHDALVDMLLREDVLIREGDLLRVRGGLSAPDLTTERQALAASHPDLAPFLTLLAQCLDHLPSLLTGQMTATEIMFPDGRMDLVEPIYQGNRLSEHFNALLADAVATLAAGAGAVVRVLEIGAGTGGATAGILRALPACVEYHYTDISRGFVQLGRQRFGADRDMMRFEVLDIERDPIAQGFPAGGFDIVVASNVLHASRRIDATLAHVHTLLRPGGALLLNEVTALQDYATLTFGLTDGWWLFEDAAIRIPNAPLLDVSGWRRVLAAAGFPGMMALGLPGEPADQHAQSMVVAQRDGVVTARAADARPDDAPVAALSEPVSTNSLEAIIATAVAAALTLPVERLDRLGRFMDYGIDSILGGQLIARLNTTLGLDLRPTVVFDHPTIRDLARHIEREHGARVRLPAAAEGPASVGPLPKAEPTPVASTQMVVPVAAGARDERIAVIGLAARFADCPNQDAFLSMLREGRSGITEVPADRWSADAAALPDGVSSEARFLRWGGFLQDAADFDPLFFRISGKEAELTDPQHRVFLTEAWRALEDAGYAERELDGRRCGVFVGAYGGDYTHRMTDLGIVPEAFAFMGNAAAILSARIAYVLNLKGPCLAVDTACSSSLTAIHLACRSLLDGDCDMALAGGVFLTTTMGFNTAAAKAGMLSPTGACKTFDADADGFVPGEGAGVVVLKPYARALADGDHIEAVIVASAINQDGRTNGITAPSPESQAALEMEVYEKAGISPEAISYIETHGTGTRLGDPIEIQGLTRAFRRWTDRTGFCTIGSVKTNIGHAAHAAGVAGFLKTILALRERTLFPSLHFRTENPELRLPETPFVVNTTLRTWESHGRPRLAAVSSFGFSGTNVHILLSEHEAPPRPPVSTAPCLIVLSGRNAAALGRRKADLLAWLRMHDAPLADIARTLSQGRGQFEHRWAVIAASRDDLMAALAADDAPAFPPTADPALQAAAETYLRTGEVVDSAIPRDGRRISLPTYPFEMRRYWLDAPNGRAAARSAKPTAVARATYLAPVWDADPLPPATAPSGAVWLIGTDTSVLAETWRAAGLQVSTIAPRDRTGLATLRQRDGAPSAVVVLGAPIGVDPLGATALPFDLDVMLDVVRTLFADPVRVLYVHRGSAAQSALAALHRSVRFDGAALDLRFLAVEDAVPATALPDLIAAELAAPVIGPIEASIRGGQRRVRRMQQATAPATSPSLRQGGHVLITGGGGVLAALFARRLAATSQARITLLGRSPASDAARAVLAEVYDAAYVQADVTDQASVERALAAARAARGPIHAVIHAAGVPGGTMLRQNDLGGVMTCLAPKIAGTVVLDRALAGEALDFFVLFSSLASEIGDFGQGAYAAGNAFCDRFAAWREEERAAGRRTGRTLALGWPLWREGRGVLSAEGERIYLATAGMPYLETEQGWQAFLDGLAMTVPQMVVIPGEPQAALALFAPRQPAAPIVTAPVVAAPVVAAPVVAPASAARRVATPVLTGAGTDVDTVRRHLTAMISRQMKIDEDLLDPGAGLAEFGFDSIALKEFSVRLGDDYGITVSPAVFFARGTIDALASYLLETHATEVAARHSPSTPPGPVELPDGVPATVAPIALSSPTLPADAVAVIGVSGRFPGSDDLTAFWRHLEAGTDLVGPLPEGRDLAAQRPYDRTALRGGFLDRIDLFDASFFRISPREACFLDPQHRLAIEAVWHCVEDAGLRMSALAGRPIGVFFGPQINEYGAIIPDRDAARAQIALGNIATMLPNRISYLFDLRGPSEAIDTACSSSLVAVHRAVRALQAGECEMALAGGVSLVLTAESIVSTMELGVVSPDGRCHSFDARANGYVKGEGVGVVLLKPLAKALADGDVIHAVIRGSAENHGGHAHSLTAPNGTAQAALIATALRRAGVPSDTIGYIEAHGTGTELGDPVEVMALKEAFAATAEPGTVAARSCLLGTVKTNIGHLEPASGVAGLIKTVLALRNGVLPASLHFQQLNPLIDFANTPFAVNDRTRAWAPLADPSGRALPRRAGVSSFGLGGSNVHVVLEEPPALVPAVEAERPELLLASARDRDRLAALLRRLAAFAADHPDLAVADVAHTLLVGREAMDIRAALVWQPGQSLSDRLAAAASVVEGGDAPEVWVGTAARTGLGRSEPAGHMAGLLEGRHLARMAALWVAGAEMPSGVTRGRRIALPGYPFARTRHWFDRAAAPPVAPATVMPVALPAATPAMAQPARPIPPVPAPQSAYDEIRPAAPVPASGRGGRSLDQVRTTVRRLLAAALYLDESALDDHAGFADLGLDSILAVELTKSLNDELGTDLQATRLYDYANVADLAAFLHGGGETASSVPPAAAIGPGLETIRATVRRLLAAALYLDESALDDHAGFADLGLDSILAVELTKSLNDELGTDLQATRLYDYANVAELAAHLHEAIGGGGAVSDAQTGPAADFLIEQLGAIGATGLTLATRLDAIVLQPAQAKSILGAVNTRFGCDLTESDVGRCQDIGRLVALIATRSPVVDPRRVALEASPPPVSPPRQAEVGEAAALVLPRPEVLTADVPQPAGLAAEADRTEAPVVPVADTVEVAIVGYACRLPGAPDAEAFWELMRRGDVAVSAFPTDEWRADAYRAALRAVAADVVPYGGYLTGIDRFDPAFFSIRAEQARLMDPQQRLFLETAWHALEMAGQTRAMLDGAACGVFVGGGASDYGRVLEAHDAGREPEALMGNTASILAARIAYFLNLHGPCVAIDTACSSGLVALHAGWRAILDGDCDMALVGGVNLLLTPQMHVLTGAGGMLSPDGHCRSFDDAADGFVPAEGIVALVLKRLDRAVADGDPIQGVIRGVAVNQNGTTAGITAPSARAQVRLLDGLYRRRGIDPRRIGLLEAHGTGTRIGDALEFDALRQVFAAAGAEPETCVLASAKPSIGHAFAASGLASVVKLLLALRHQELPPTLGPDHLNQHMRLAASPFRLTAHPEPWPAPDDGPRMAAATSYGLSGTNAHVVIADPQRVDPPAAPTRDWHLVVISGTDAAALRRQIASLAEALSQDPPPLPHLAYTLARRRTHFTERAAFVVRDVASLRTQLAAWPTTVAGGPAALWSIGAEYVAGRNVAFETLYPTGRVCALPGYRFAGERFWPDDSAATTEARMLPVAEGPNEGVTARLCAVIARALGVAPERVTPDVSFDLLGMNSLAAVTLMRMAEATFGVTLPVIALWDHPTPAQLAAFIAGQPPAAPRDDLSLAQAGRTPDGAHDPVVPIRQGRGPISFWVHGGPGDVNWVPDLARHLPADSCVYGLEAVGLDGDTDPLPTVEAMAAHYVAAVRRTQPEGPYVLGGYSAGGAIAYEMARQMAEAGLPVQRLVLLDANAPGNASVAGMQAAFGPGYVYLVVGNWFGLRWGMT
ncbi:MAG: SDR family NAD(P)-dependent oxidoreductase, partial [Acetobacteraceae bacterium]